MLERLERAAARPWGLIRAFIKLYQHDRRATFPIPLKTRLAMWRRGFVRECHLVYGFDHNPVEHYLPEYHRLVRASRINRKPEVLHHKLLFEAFFKALLPIPKTLAWISGGVITPLVPDPWICSPEALLEACRALGRLAVKPFGESGGRGFRVLAWEDGRFLLDRAPLDRAGLGNLVSQARDIMVTEFAWQGEYAARVYPHSTNSMRVLTMRDPFQNRRAFVAIAVHRFGSSRSAPADSFQKGGFACEVDLATGVLGKATTYPREGRVEWFSRHPETGEQIEGLRVPGWENLVQRLLAATEAYDFLDYVAWDVVAREDGFLVLEGNNHSGMVFLQMHRGLLADERVRAFFEYHRVIRPRRRRLA
ncbi:MAG: sugar-transfer associated ATP-grasp domain-containing protein [Bryobacterales bacterium]|nr:sugar-transfer associated ATP-grasp domain-containing protein [Bryobacterales bacterium]